MDEMGKAMMGTGEASGEDRAVQAAEKAIANPLLDEISLHGAKGVLINITGGYDLTLFELDEAANIIREKVDPDANIIVGSTLDTSMEGMIRVSVVATGIDAAKARDEVPVARRSMAAPLPQATHVPVAEPRREPVVAVPAMTEVEAVTLGLFDAVAPHAADEFDTDGDDYTDVPAPAYRPQPTVQHRAPAPQIDADAAEFVAPRPRSAGTPSPEAMARLQAAVSKSPVNRPGMAAQAPRPAAQAPRPAAPAPAARPVAEKPRFGIGSLINRMAGNLEQQADRAPAPRQQPPVTSYDDEPELSADQERIEIPAFLRRQAN